MNAQEQEHWDHEAGAQSELLNCLDEARMDLARLNHKDSETIGRALAKGLFVVVRDSTHYCRSTDAIAGTRKSYASAFGNRQEAEGLVAHIVNSTQGEDSAYVLPRLPDPVRELSAAWANRPQEDECPF